MPLVLRRRIVPLLIVIAAVGWIYALNLSVRVLPNAVIGAPAMAELVERFTYQRFATLQDGNWIPLERYVAGPAEEAFRRQRDAKPSPMNEAAIEKGTLDTSVLMAAGGRALVVVDYQARRTISEGLHPIRELVLLGLVDTEPGARDWRVLGVWQVAPTNADPLVPTSELLETIVPTL